MTCRAVVAVGAAALVLLSACGGSDTSSPSGRVAITAADDACQVATTTFQPGTHTFTVTNEGNQITEVYIYGEQNGAFTKVISEVEDIGPGLSRELSATLTSGQYEVACKPGQTGDGLRTRITVTAAPAAATAGMATTARSRSRSLRPRRRVRTG